MRAMAAPHAEKLEGAVPAPPPPPGPPHPAGSAAAGGPGRKQGKAGERGWSRVGVWGGRPGPADAASLVPAGLQMKSPEKKRRKSNTQVRAGLGAARGGPGDGPQRP